MRAAIDLGSNTCLLLIVDGDLVVHEAAHIVGLGRGLGDAGTLDPTRVAAAMEALTEHVATAARFGIQAPDIVAATTSAVRRAADADAFLGRVRQATGVRFRVLTGPEEAATSFRGATSDQTGGPWLVIDIGGGSTELAQGHAGHAPHTTSLEIGSIRATEAHLSPQGERLDADRLPAITRATHHLLRTWQAPGPVGVIGVAGTVLTLASLLHGVPLSQTHGLTVTHDAILPLADDLARMSPAARRAAVHVAPERAAFLPAGATILAAILDHVGGQGIMASHRDLRWGLLAHPVAPAR